MKSYKLFKSNGVWVVAKKESDWVLTDLKYTDLGQARRKLSRLNKNFLHILDKGKS